MQKRRKLNSLCWFSRTVSVTDETRAIDATGIVLTENAMKAGGTLLNEYVVQRMEELEYYSYKISDSKCV